MSPFLTHLVLGSIGLVLAVALGQLLLWFWRRRPLASYRLFSVLLFGGLFLPPAQVAMEHWRPARELPLVQRLAGVRASLERAPAESTRERAADPLADLSTAELETLMRVLAEEPEAPEPVPSETGLAAGFSSFLERFPGGLAGLLAALYAAGVLLALVRLVRRLVRTRALVRAAVPVTDPVVCGVWHELAAASRIGPRLELLASHAIQAPVCFGLGRRVILMPAAPEASPFARWEPDVLRCVLLHELVHLERRDTWVMLAQELFRAVFWFHPAAWFLCRKLDALRELSCDLLVVQRTGHKKRYAQALLEYAAWMKRVLPSPSSTALLPWSGSKSQLSRRIEMLVSLPSQRSFPWTTVPAAVSLISCLWGGQLAVAASLSGPSGQDPQPTAPAVAPTAPVAPTPGAPTPWAQTPGAPASPQPTARPLPSPFLAPAPLPDARPAPDPLIARSPSLPSPALLLPPGPFTQEDPTAAWLAPLQGSTQDTPLIGVWLGDDASSGVRINQVMTGSLAERHGLQAGDEIVRINGEPASRAVLERAKKLLRTGSMLLQIRRGNETLYTQLGGQDWPRLDAARAYQEALEQSRPLLPRPKTFSSGQDEIQEARAALERALARNPEDSAVRRALESLMAVQDARAESNEARNLEQLERDAAANAQARGDYEKALRSLKLLEELKRLRTYQEPVKEYNATKPDYWRNLERQRSEEASRSEEANHRASIEARLRSTEVELEQRMRELEELKARIRALESSRSSRYGDGAARTDGVRSSGAGPSGTGPAGGGEPLGRSIARELAEMREPLAEPPPDAPEPVEPMEPRRPGPESDGVK